MGGLLLETHWNRIVLASVQEFLAAEDHAVNLPAGSDGQLAVYEGLRRGMVAILFLHHFAEVAKSRQHPVLRGMKRPDVYHHLSLQTFAPDGTPRPDDWKILGEAADAVKHGELTAGHIRHVDRNGRVIEWSHAPALPEGRVNDEPQIIIGTANGPRPLRALLLNICNAWSGWLGLAALK